MRRELTEQTARGLSPGKTKPRWLRPLRVDGEAFAALYRHYRQPIYRYCRARSRSDEDAADLAQQVFLKAFEAMPRYEERGFPSAPGSTDWRITPSSTPHAAPAARYRWTSCQRPGNRASRTSRKSARWRRTPCFAFNSSSHHSTRSGATCLRCASCWNSPPRRSPTILGKRDTAVRAQLKRALDTSEGAAAWPIETISSSATPTCLIPSSTATAAGGGDCSTKPPPPIVSSSHPPAWIGEVERFVRQRRAPALNGISMRAIDRQKPHSSSDDTDASTNTPARQLAASGARHGRGGAGRRRSWLAYWQSRSAIRLTVTRADWVAVRPQPPRPAYR